MKTSRVLSDTATGAGVVGAAALAGGLISNLDYLWRAVDHEGEVLESFATS